MNNWKKVRLGDISDMCLGKMLDKGKNKGEFQPYLANLNVRWGSFDLMDLNEMRFEESEQDRYGLQFGDIVMCEGGEPGRCAIWKDEVPNMKIQKALHRIRIKGEYSNQFVYYRFLLAGRNGELEKHFIGSTIKHLTGITLKKVEFACPSLKEQQKIAAVLSALDAKIELNRRINAELETLAKTLYDYWFVQFDFPDAQGKPYKTSGGKMVWSEALKREVPEGWEVKRLEKITDTSTESVNPMAYHEKEFKHYSIPVFDETGTYQVEKGAGIQSNKFVVSKDDVLVSKLNPWFNRVVFAPDEENLISSTEFVVWRSPSQEMKNYLFRVAKEQSFISYCTQSAAGTSNSHKRVNPTVMMQFQMPFKKSIATEFGKRIDPILKKQFSILEENKHLTALRDWLLPLLMNGQLRVG